MSRFNEFRQIVKKYAEAYFEFEEFQKQEETTFIPQKGDQKTGVIGEAYIYEYLSKSSNCKLKFGNHSEKGWDIKSSKYKYQVKTVSEYSRTKIISPIHDGWDFLYFVHLNKRFEPDKIYKIKNPGNLNDKVIRGLRFPNEEKQTIIINNNSCILYDETNEFMRIMNIKIT